MARRITVLLVIGLLISSVIIVFSSVLGAHLWTTRIFSNMGRQNADLGAHMTEYVIEKAIANGILDLAGVFSNHYERIPGDGPPRYHSAYDRYLETNLGLIHDAFLIDTPIYYTYSITQDGYIPIHTDPARGKLLLAPEDRVAVDPRYKGRFDGLWQAPDGHGYYEYAAPIMVRNRKWGEFRVGIPVALFTNQIEGNVVRYTSITAVLFSLLAAFVFIVVHRGIRPLVDLARVTAQMGAGDFSVRGTYARNDEIGALTRSFNAMADRIQEAQSTLEKHVEERTAQLAQANQALQDSQQRWTDIISFLPDAVFAIDPGGKVIAWNQAMEDLTGHSASEMLGKGNYEYALPFYGMRRPMLIDLMLYPDEDFERDYVAILREKGYIVAEGIAPALKRYVWAKASPFYDAEGRVAGAVESLRDVTDRRRVEEALRASEERFRAISASAQDAIIMMDPEGRVSFWNNAAERIFGWPPAEIIGKDIHLLLAPKTYRGAFLQAWDRFRKTGEGAAIGRTLELSALRRDGAEFPMEIALAAVKLQDQWHAVGIIRDITERKQAEEALREAKDAAEAAARAKSQFLANMSHEIRTPMSGVLSMMELLGETPLNNEQHEYVEIAASSGQALLALINDILDFSKIEAGKLELEQVPFDIRSTAEDASDMLAARAQAKGLEFALLVHHNVPLHVLGDPNRLRQILVNLAGNAIKFTKKGEVSIRVGLGCPVESLSPESGPDTTKVRLRFEVTDTGVGIAPDQLGRLFQSFTQADASTTRKYGGSGLGLAISKQLVEAMGGFIGVESQLGRGSTFWFTVVFPRAETPPSSRTSESRDDFGNLRILVVDDTATNRMAFGEQLARHGCSILAASSGSEALAILSASVDDGHPVDLALLDLQMPVMDGLELGRRIKADPRIAGTRLILCTSSPRHGDADKISALGFDGYLTKPVRHADLRETVRLVARAGAANAHNKGTRLVTRHTAREASRTKLLLVEDAPVNQKAAARMLQKLGYGCDLAGNGREAVEAAARGTYDLIFMDCQMPEMDGFEATRLIREAEGDVRHTPIVAMTAMAMQGDEARCLAAGMDGYVAKPITFDALKTVLERFLSTNESPPTREDRWESEPPAPSESPVNLSRLHDYAEGDPELEREFINAFIEDMTFRLKTLGEVVASADATGIEHAAHAIKGASGTIGAAQLSDIARDMEDRARGGNVTESAAQFDAMRSEYERVRGFLESVPAMRRNNVQESPNEREVKH